MVRVATGEIDDIATDDGRNAAPCGSRPYKEKDR